MSADNSSPFTVPSVEDQGYEFEKEDAPKPPPAPPKYTLGNLLGSLQNFSVWHANARKAVERNPSLIRVHDDLQISASVSGYRESLNRIPGFGDLRAFTLSTWGEEVTPTTCRRVLGLLVQSRPDGISVAAAESLELTEVVARLRGGNSPRQEVNVLPHSKPANPPDPQTSVSGCVLDTTPDYSEPPERTIKAAAEDLPGILQEMPNETRLCPSTPGHGNRVVLGDALVGELTTRLGHTKAAAAWAIHRLIGRGLLEAEIASRVHVPVLRHEPDTSHPLYEGFKNLWPDDIPMRSVYGAPIRVPLAQPDRPVPYKCLLIRSTAALWDWWREPNDDAGSNNAMPAKRNRELLRRALLGEVRLTPEQQRDVLGVDLTQAVPVPHPEQQALANWASIEVVGGKFPPGWEGMREGAGFWHVCVDGNANDWLPVIERYTHRLFGKAITEGDLIGYLNEKHGLTPAEAKELRLAKLAEILKEDVALAARPPSEAGMVQGHIAAKSPRPNLNSIESAAAASTSTAAAPADADAAVTIDLEAQALALLFQHPDWSVPQIAEFLKLDRKTPYKWKKFREAAEMQGKLKPRGPKDRKPRRGHKTRDGNIEAYADEDDDKYR